MTSNAELMGQTLDDIADAIREKRGILYNIPMLNMAEEIRKLHTQNEFIIINCYIPPRARPIVSNDVLTKPVPKNVLTSNVSPNTPSIQTSLTIS